MQFLDKLGWPVERVKGRPVLNFLRLLIHTRKIKRGKFVYKQEPSPNVTCGNSEHTDNKTQPKTSAFGDAVRKHAEKEGIDLDVKPKQIYGG